MKKGYLKHGQLAPRVVPAVPWMEVHCDEIGPWTCKIQGNEVKV